MSASRHQDGTFRLAEWALQVYQAPDRPTGRQRDVLVALATRFTDWRTGAARASILGLAAYCQAGRSTVQRALAWGRRAGLIIRTMRGHRAGDGTIRASEWQLVTPSSLRLFTPAEEAALNSTGVTS